MKKIVVVVFAVLSFLVVGYCAADDATLNPAIALSPNTAAKLQIRSIELYPVTEEIVVKYRWLSANGTPLYIPGQRDSSNTWIARNDLGEPVANCTSAGVPYACCTDAGAGTGCRAADMAFDKIARFSIRAQDVGTSLVKGLRTLIVARMKAELPVLSNITVSFAD